MNKSIVKKLPLLLCGMALLASCNQPAPAQGTSELDSQELVDTNAETLFEAFNKLSTLRNYDVVTTVVDSEVGTSSYRDYFKPNYVFSAYPDDSVGFGENNGEVFRIDLYHGDYIASEAYDATSLWDSNLFSTLAFSPSIFSKTSELEIELTNKKAKMQWLEFLRLDTAHYINIVSASISLSNHDLSGLRFILDLGEVKYKSSLTNFGKAGDKELDAFVANAVPAEIDPALLKMKEDFLGNNFTRVVHEYITEGEEENAVIGAEYYTEEYWYGHFTSESGYYIYSQGFLSLHNKKIVSEEGTAYFDGAYRFTLSEDLTQVASFLAVGPAFVTNEYYMPAIMNYPSQMSLWDHNLHFFQEMQTSSENELAFITDDALALYEFYNMSQVANVLPEDFATRSLRKLEAHIHLAEEGESDEIRFVLELKNDGTVYRCEFIYQDFGKTSLPAVEEFAALFEDDIQGE